MNLRTLKGQVEYILQNKAETRNSDVALTVAIWRRFFPSFIYENEGHDYVRLSELAELPREDNVKRVRAHFQNDLGLYLPTDESVREARGINEEKWRETLGYKNTQTL